MLFVFSLDSFITCDYCKPWSKFFKNTSNNDVYYSLMKDRINNENKSSDIIKKRIVTKGLDDDEL